MNTLKKYAHMITLATITLANTTIAAQYTITLNNLQLFDTTAGLTNLVAPATYDNLEGTSYAAGFDVNLNVFNLAPSHAGIGNYQFNVALAWQAASANAVAAQQTAGLKHAWFVDYGQLTPTNNIQESSGTAPKAPTFTDLEEITGTVDTEIPTSSAILGKVFLDVNPYFVDTHIGLTDIFAGAVDHNNQLLDLVPVDDSQTIHIHFPTIPEPTSLALLSLSAIAILHRKNIR